MPTGTTEDDWTVVLQSVCIHPLGARSIGAEYFDDSAAPHF
jgi:hypothetical protein